MKKWGAYWMLLMVALSHAAGESYAAESFGSEKLLGFTLGNVSSNTIYEISWAKGVIPGGATHVKDLRVSFGGECKGRGSFLSLKYCTELDGPEIDVTLDDFTKWGTFRLDADIFALNLRWSTSKPTNDCKISFHSVDLANPLPPPAPPGNGGGGDPWNYDEVKSRAKYVSMKLQLLSEVITLEKKAKPSIDYSELADELVELKEAARTFSDAIGAGAQYPQAFPLWKEFVSQKNKFTPLFLRVQAQDNNQIKDVYDHWKNFEIDYDALKEFIWGT